MLKGIMKILGQQFVWIILCTVLVSMTAGAVLSSGMMMKDGKMQNCPYMGITSLCKMDIAEHLAAWQSMFTSVSQEFNTVVLLLLLSLCLLSYFVNEFIRKKPPKQKPVFYKRDVPKIFDPLRLAFARGLIHPKIF